MGLQEFKDVLSEIAKSKRSGILKVYRKVFSDPLLYAYVLKGAPVYASSFVMGEKWYEGLLTRQEVDDNLFGNIFRYAYEKYGKRFIEHMVAYSREVLKAVVLNIAENRWEVEVEFEPKSEEYIKESLGISGKSTLESWARSLLAVGATSVYIPEKDLTVGPLKGNTLKKLYRELSERFPNSDVVYSTPFSSVFLIHKDGKPILFSSEITVGTDEAENVKNLMLSLEPHTFKGEIGVGESMEFPIYDGIGKPFSLSLREGKDVYKALVIKGDKVAHVYTMDIEGVLNLISDLAEKTTAVLYKILERFEDGDVPQSVVDMRIRILMMTHPHPDDLAKASKGAF